MRGILFGSSTAINGIKTAIVSCFALTDVMSGRVGDLSPKQAEALEEVNCCTVHFCICVAFIYV